MLQGALKLSRQGLLALFCLATAAVPLHASDLVEGIEYARIQPSQPTKVPAGKVEVVELFWYGCPHCYQFEPLLEKWLEAKPAHVEFIRIPAVMNPHWEPQARAYFTAQILGVGDKIHRPFFDAWHREKRPLRTEKEIGEFFVEHGVSKQKFQQVYRSFAVNAKVAHARGLGQRYQATSVPTMIVNGKYRTNATMAGGTHAQMLQVVDALIAQEAEAKTAAQ